MLVLDRPCAHFDNQLMRYAWRHFLSARIYGRERVIDLLQQREDPDAAVRRRAEDFLEIEGLRVKPRKHAFGDEAQVLVITTGRPVLARLMGGYARGETDWERIFKEEIPGALVE